MLPIFWRTPVPALLLCCLLPVARRAAPDGHAAEPAGRPAPSSIANSSAERSPAAAPSSGSRAESSARWSDGPRAGAGTGSSTASPDGSPTPLRSRSRDGEPADGSPTPLRSRSRDGEPADGSPTPLRSRSRDGEPADGSPTPLRSRSRDGEPADGSTASSPARTLTPVRLRPSNDQPKYESTASSPARTLTPVRLRPRDAVATSGLPPRESSSCQVVGSQADCSGRKLTRVPQWLPTNITSLDLSLNALAELCDGAFARYPLLRQLRLQFNVIARIRDGAFRGCGDLELLDLFNNSLPAVPDAQLAPLLGSLVLLNVSNNLYGRVVLGATFARLARLRHLWLGGELVSEVRAADLAALRSLNFTTFSLKTGQGFAAYEPGALASLAGSADPAVTLDSNLDAAPWVVTPMLADLAATRVRSLRFRRLFAAGYYAGAADLFEPLPRLSRLRELSFFRGKFNENLNYLILKRLQHASSVESLSLIAVDFTFSDVAELPRVPVGPLPLRELVFRDIANPDVLLYGRSFEWYGGLGSLTINNVNFNVVPCPAWAAMRRVAAVDIADNRLTDAALLNLGCDYRGTLPRLRSLAIDRNALTRLATVAQLAAEWPALRELRLANNRIGGAAERCEWRQPVELLDLSYNRAAGEVFGCLPLTLRHLDLSYSDVSSLDLDYFARADRLELLLLSGNNIKFIPPGWRSPSLGFLAVDHNSFGVIDSGTFGQMPALRGLQADNNPFQCTCDLWDFLAEVRADGSVVRLVGWPHNYTCYHPVRLLGTRLESFRPGAFECDVRLVALVSVLVTAAVAGASLALCRRFDGPWYLRALWNLLRSKRRKQERSADAGRHFRFHAFVSYSHEDAAWVREQLVPQLEAARPPLRLCVHERDFTPGMWIIDNIIESIELSRRVIFVLSGAFVDSEWCNYELYIAHQRPARQAVEDLVLLVKEPIRPESLPSRFCKLRKLLSRKTYLEWPTDSAKQVLFWAQLRAVVSYDEGMLLDDAETEAIKADEATGDGRSL